MSFTIVQNQPALRSVDLAWADIGPGLYDDGEVLVELDSNFVAISVDITWLENGAGVSIKSTARWCDETGQTLLCNKGSHVESAFSYTVDPIIVEQFGIQAVTKDVTLIALGENVETFRDCPQEDGSIIQVALIDPDMLVKHNASIRRAIENVQAVSEITATGGLFSMLTAVASEVVSRSQ